MINDIGPTFPIVTGPGKDNRREDRYVAPRHVRGTQVWRFRFVPVIEELFVLCKEKPSAKSVFGLLAVRVAHSLSILLPEFGGICGSDSNAKPQDGACCKRL